MIRHIQPAFIRRFLNCLVDFPPMDDKSFQKALLFVLFVCIITKRPKSKSNIAE